jgi:hypothetical protein
MSLFNFPYMRLSNRGLVSLLSSSDSSIISIPSCVPARIGGLAYLAPAFLLGS